MLFPLDSLYRKRYITEGLSFCSNDYLGLSRQPKVIDAFQKSAKKYGVGSGSSNLLGGYTHAHKELEEELADFMGYERALVFSSGYMANIGIGTALIKSTDRIYANRLNHASLVDTMKYSQAKFKRYHAIPDNVEKKSFIISDGVFSMDGNIAQLDKLNKTAKESDGFLIVDDAHGVGILGEKGRGSIEHHNVKPDIVTSSFGKAFGTMGAFVASSEDVIETLIQSARTYMYTVSLPPAIADATRASLKIIQEEPWRREYLKKLVNRFKKTAVELGINLMQSETPIQPILMGSSEEVMKIFHNLKDKGIFVSAIRPPTVPKGQERLRISLNVNHTEQQVDYLLETLLAVIPRGL